MQYNLDHINLLEKMIKDHFFEFSDEVQKRAIKKLLRMRAAGNDNQSRKDEISIIYGDEPIRHIFDNFELDENGNEKRIQTMTLETPEGERIVVTPKGIIECQVTIRNIYPILRNEQERKELYGKIKNKREQINTCMNRVLDLIPSTIKKEEVFQNVMGIEQSSSDIKQLLTRYIEHETRLHYDTKLTVTDVLIPHGISDLNISGFTKYEGSDNLVRERKDVDPQKEIQQDELLYEIEDCYDVDLNKTHLEKDFMPLDVLFYKNDVLKKALKVYKARHGYDFTPANHYMPPREKNHKK